MDWEDWLPWLAVLTVIACGLAIKALVERARRDRRCKRLPTRCGCWTTLAAARRTSPALLPAEPSADAAPPIEAPEAPAAELTTPEPEPAATDLPPVAPALPSDQAPALTRARENRRLEKLLVENWLVWLGGVALALGGAFLVKLSIDQGWLTPLSGSCSACCLGSACSGGRMGCSPRSAQRGNKTPSISCGARLPPAPPRSSPASYAAHQLYGLLPSPLAFALLALTAGATVGVSLRHGPFVAALGLGRSVCRAASGRERPAAALPLFAYLTSSAAAYAPRSCASRLELARWIWLGGSTFWVISVLVSAPTTDTAVLGGFLLGQLGLFCRPAPRVPRIGFLAESAIGRWFAL